ncbi:MAG: retropepsin-like domain-containing protein [Gammaproteobacteria bacterium]|jgi:predicted aspartyl protease|nr:retropepsin-like domain-containing protein [Gammaproteobacteria bacterium]
MKINYINRVILFVLLFSFNVSFARDTVSETASTLYYQIPAGVKKLATPIDINLENIETENFIVKATINGKGSYQFMVDTGIPITMISKEVAQDLNLQSPQVKDFTGNYTNLKSVHYKIKELSLGEAALYDYDVAVLDEPNIITNDQKNRLLKIEE